MEYRCRAADIARLNLLLQRRQFREQVRSNRVVVAVGTCQVFDRRVEACEIERLDPPQGEGDCETAGRVQSGQDRRNRAATRIVETRYTSSKIQSFCGAPAIPAPSRSTYRWPGDSAIEDNISANGKTGYVRT